MAYGDFANASLPFAVMSHWFLAFASMSLR